MLLIDNVFFIMAELGFVLLWLCVWLSVLVQLITWGEFSSGALL